jgi:hypothetical protein
MTAHHHPCMAQLLVHGLCMCDHDDELIQLRTALRAAAKLRAENPDVHLLGPLHPPLQSGRRWLDSLTD